MGLLETGLREDHAQFVGSFQDEFAVALRRQAGSIRRILNLASAELAGCLMRLDFAS